MFKLRSCAISGHKPHARCPTHGATGSGMGGRQPRLNDGQVWREASHHSLGRRPDDDHDVADLLPGLDVPVRLGDPV
jgi:hypothetical protein